MSVASTTSTHHPLIDVGQQFKALPQSTRSPEGVDWDYPHGEGIITVECVSQGGEPTEFGERPWEAVWFRFEGSDEVQALSPHYFLLAYTPLTATRHNSDSCLQSV